MIEGIIVYGLFGLMLVLITFAIMYFIYENIKSFSKIDTVREEDIINYFEEADGFKVDDVVYYRIWKSVPLVILKIFVENDHKYAICVYHSAEGFRSQEMPLNRLRHYDNVMEW